MPSSASAHSANRFVTSGPELSGVFLRSEGWTETSVE